MTECLHPEKALRSVGRVRILQSHEVVKSVLESPDRFMLWLGAGASVEAGVKSAPAVCSDIRDELIAANPGLRNADRERIDEWARTKLDWDNPERRYGACISELGPAVRVEYFRNLLRGRQPSFAHHAAALLMTHGYLKRTCLTTNFDHLLENAFVQQGYADCQVLRSAEDIGFWEDRPNRAFVVKLHGDIDTKNILNTPTETMWLPEELREFAAGRAANSGLLVIGSSGYEASIRDLIRKLAGDSRALPFGLLWGVYVGDWEPGRSDADVRQLVEEAVTRQVSSDVRDVIDNGPDEYAFYPVFGAGGFFAELLDSVPDESVRATGERYLDQDLRLRNLLHGSAELSHETVTSHLERLRKKRLEFDEIAAAVSPEPDPVMTLDVGDFVELRVAYGDITSPAMMAAEEFAGLTRAIVSPDDTYVSAGGGVAYGLLTRAGRLGTLTELSKFAPVGQHDVVATSAGALPVHYVLHAAALRLEDDPDNPWRADKSDVNATATNVLLRAQGLEVDVIWFPLIAAGTAGVGNAESFGAIVEAAAQFEALHATRPMIVYVMVYANRLLDRHEIKSLIAERLPGTA